MLLFWLRFEILLFLCILFLLCFWSVSVSLFCFVLFLYVFGFCCVSDPFCFCYDRSDFEMTLDMLAQNRIDTKGLVTKSINLEDFPQAFEDLKKTV